MKFKTIAIVNAALAFVFGIMCVLIPSQLLANYNVTLPPMGLVIYQFWGATLIGIGLLTWSVRNVGQLALQKAVALSLFITNGISCIMAVRGQSAGANDMGWSIVALYALLAIAWGVLAIIKPRSV